MKLWGNTKSLTTAIKVEQAIIQLMQTRTPDSDLITFVGNWCDPRSHDSQRLARHLPEFQMQTIRNSYQSLMARGINFERYINPYYRFEKILDRGTGKPSRYGQPYRDDRDFTIHPDLLKACDLKHCPDHSPEGQALWLYTQLCATLRYDEGYFYQDQRQHPNDDAFQSFRIVDQVTPKTPTTCFNISRIAVKLLNQIPGVTATTIMLGANHGHFRFGFYTDHIAVDAEPCKEIDGYNDLARVKLGLPPLGLKSIHGEQMVNELLSRVTAPFCQRQKKLQTYIQTILAKPKTTFRPQIDVTTLLKQLRAHNVDGAATVQLLIQLNHHFNQAPLEIARAAMNDTDTLVPTLLVRGRHAGTMDLTQINLYDLETTTMAQPKLRHLKQNFHLLYADKDHTIE